VESLEPKLLNFLRGSWPAGRAPGRYSLKPWFVEFCSCAGMSSKVKMNKETKLMGRYAGIALGLLCSSALFAASPAAMLSSVGAVRVAGTDMSASTVALWPLAEGDRIEALSSPAVVILPDRSRVTVNPGSMARIESVGGVMTVRLLPGSDSSKVSSETSNGRFISLGRPVSPRTPPVSENGADPRLPGFRHP